MGKWNIEANRFYKVENGNCSREVIKCYVLDLTIYKRTTLKKLNLDIFISVYRHINNHVYFLKFL